MKRYAIFVGIDKYSNDITPLSCARKDALDLSMEFAAAGFERPQVILDGDAGCPKITREVSEVCKKMQSGDLLVFYFAGHGRELNGEHYLIGKDGYADPALHTLDSLPMSALVNMTNKPGIRRLFILDCCRDNLLAGRSIAFARNDGEIMAMEKAVKSQSGFIPPLILNSCSSGEKAFEDHSSGHGYFTSALLKTIADTAVKGFDDFRKKLQKNMKAPGAQNICWNGNVDNWDEVELFHTWGKSAEEAAFASLPKPANYYDVLLVFEEGEKTLADTGIKISPELTNLKRKADFARKNGDFNSEIAFRQQFCANVKEVIATRQKLLGKCRTSRAKVEKLLQQLDLLGVKNSEKKKKSLQDIDRLIASGEPEKAVAQLDSCLAGLESAVASAITRIKDDCLEKVAQFRSGLKEFGVVPSARLEKLAGELKKCSGDTVVLLAADIGKQITLEEDAAINARQFESLEKSLQENKLVIAESDRKLKKDAFSAWEKGEFETAVRTFEYLNAHLDKQLASHRKSEADIRKKIAGLREQISKFIAESTACELELPAEYRQWKKEAEKAGSLPESLSAWEQAALILRTRISGQVRELQESIAQCSKEIGALRKKMKKMKVRTPEHVKNNSKLAGEKEKKGELKAALTLRQEEVNALLDTYYQAVSEINAGYPPAAAAWENVFMRYGIQLPDGYIRIKNEALTSSDPEFTAEAWFDALELITKAMQASSPFDPMREALKMEKQLETLPGEYVQLRSAAEQAWESVDVDASIAFWQQANYCIGREFAKSAGSSLLKNSEGVQFGLSAFAAGIFASIAWALYYTMYDSFWAGLGCAMVIFIFAAIVSGCFFHRCCVSRKGGNGLLKTAAFLIPAVTFVWAGNWWMAIILSIVPFCGAAVFSEEPMVKTSFSQAVLSVLRAGWFTLFITFSAAVLYIWCQCWFLSRDLSGILMSRQEIMFFAINAISLFFMITQNTMLISAKISGILWQVPAIAGGTYLLSGGNWITAMINVLIYLVMYWVLMIPDTSYTVLKKAGAENK